jgi:hypothetical protein
MSTYEEDDRRRGWAEELRDEITLDEIAASVAELHLDSEVAATLRKIEHGERSQAFDELEEFLDDLIPKTGNQKKNEAVLYPGQSLDVISRSVLLIRNKTNKRFPTSTRIIVSDEVLTDDASGRIIQGTQYWYRPLGRLMSKHTCSVGVDFTEPQIDPDGFFMQKDPNLPIINVFHGLMFPTEQPTDPPRDDS